MERKGKDKGKSKNKEVSSIEGKRKGKSISKCQDESTTKDENKGSGGSSTEGQGKGNGASSTEDQGKGKGKGKSSKGKGDFISKCQEESATKGKNKEDVVVAIQEASIDPSTIQKLLCCSEKFGKREVQFRVLPQRTCTSSYLLQMEMNNFDVERDNSQGFLLTVERYKLTLGEWIKQNQIRWCLKHKSWNSVQSKCTNSVEGVLNWNSNRPTKECKAIIAGVVKAVFDYHASGNVHGYLNEPSSFLLRKEEKVVMDVPVISYHVILTHSPAMDLDIKNVSKETDIKLLDDLIFNTILPLDRKNGVRKLPREWIDFRDELNNANRNLFFLKTHPCLWHEGEKLNYYVIFYKKFVQTQKPGRAKFDQAISSITWDRKEWKELIPINSPMKRFYDERERIRDNSAESFFRYVRGFSQHYLDKKWQDKKEIYTYIQNNEKDYHDPEFVEMCCTECFPSVLLNTYKEACKNKLYKEL